jgi:anti-sigma-K factor RskA
VIIERDDLDLQAVRYVTGELDATESAAFEALLADDQAARDAVEFAVRVAVVSVEDVGAQTPALSTAGPERRFWRMLAAAAALIICAAVAYQFVMTSTDNPGALGTGSTVAGSQGVDSQAKGTEIEDQVLIASWIALSDLAETDDTAERDEATDFDELSEVAGVFGAVDTPDWMMQGLMK